MAEEIAKLYVGIGGDNSGLKKTLKDTKTELEKTKRESKSFSEGLADSLQKSGYEFGNIRKEMNSWNASLKGATQRNQDYSMHLATITDRYKAGKISAEEARAKIETLSKSYDAGLPAMERFGAGLKSFALKFATVAAGAAAVGIALKQTFEAGQMGAELLYTQEKFDRLANSVGVTADVMMRDLREATKGTISDMDLAASAADLMSLGLAKNYDEVIRLTKVAGGLGMNMNQLVLTLTNQTTMRFDQLGVKVSGFKEKVDALKASGMDASAAFQEAFLRQAEEQLGTIGNKADSTAGAYMRLEASMANLADTAKMRLAPALVPVIDLLSGASWQQLNDELRTSADEAKNSTTSYRGYSNELKKIAAAHNFVINSNGDLVQQMGSGAARVIQANYLMSESLWGIVTATEAIPQDMSERLNWLHYSDIAEIVKAAEEIEQVKRKSEELALFQRGPVKSENQRYLTTQKEIQAALKKTADRITELKKTPWQKEEIAAAETEYKGLEEQVKQNQETHNTASKQIIFDLASQMMAQDGLTTAEADAQVAMAEKFGLIDQSTADMWEALKKPVEEMSNGKTTAEEWEMVMKRLATNWFVTVTWTNEGDVPEFAGPLSRPMASNNSKNKPPAQQSNAEGGTYMRGVPRLVGERGPELDLPSTSGRVISNEELRRMLGAGGGGGGVTQHINVSLSLPRENYSATQLVRELQRLGGV